MNFNQKLDTSWDQVARSLLLSLKSMVKPQLLVLDTKSGYGLIVCRSGFMQMCFILFNRN